MKYLLTLLAVVSVGAHAAVVNFTNGDGSPDTQACIDAAQGEKIKDKSIKCNGMPIKKFAKKYRQRSAEKNLETVSVKVYALKPNNDADETTLCIAAATSKEVYDNLLSNMKYKGNPDKIRCNDMPINKFADKYRK